MLIQTKKHHRKVFGYPGDIDDRLKLLIDALRMPTQGEIKKGKLTWSGSEAMNCPLEDGGLVDRLSVQTDYLHRGADPGHVLAVIGINTRADQLTLENSALAA